MQDFVLKQQYLSNWHDRFVRYVQWVWSYIDTIEKHSQITEKDKCGLDAINLLLSGNDVIEIERNLTEGSTTGALKKRYVRKDRKVE